MNIYVKFLLVLYTKSFFYVFAIMLSLVILLNVLTEIEFFKDYTVGSFLPLYLAFLNSFDLILEIFPFIFLLTTQVFFVHLFSDNQINIFKYSGLKNIKIIRIISILTFFFGILIITGFYSFSSNLKNLYFDYKNKYTLDNKYLAVVTNNGLWIKDIIDQKILIVNAKEIEKNFLKNVTINIFDNDFNPLEIIISEKADVKSKEWILNDTISIKNEVNSLKEKRSEIKINSNFDLKKINSLFSNLSSLSILELISLRKNYKTVNYSTIEINIQLQKLISYPFYFTLMSMFSSIIMFNTKRFKSNSLKITLGLFFCVLIYYLNSIFLSMASTGKIPYQISVWITLIILLIINFTFLLRINEN